MQRLDPLEAPLEESYELLAEEWWAASLQLRMIWPFWCVQQHGQKQQCPRKGRNSSALGELLPGLLDDAYVSHL